jgi:hypothetical protein
VRGRMELMRETSRTPMQPLPAPVSAPAPQMPRYAARPSLYGKPLHSHKVLPLARPRLMA